VASEEFKSTPRRGRRADRRRRRRSGLAASVASPWLSPPLLIAVPALRDRRAMAEVIGDHVGISLTREEPFDVSRRRSENAGTVVRRQGRFPLHIPRIPQAKLVGARLCHVAGRHIPLASYELGTRRVSLFVERSRRRARPTVCDEHVHGYTVCRRTLEGIEYLFVSDYPAREAEGILTAALERRAAMTPERVPLMQARYSDQHRVHRREQLSPSRRGQRLLCVLRRRGADLITERRRTR
jgi:hypothetical protein